jgi:hypothetical protein
MPRCIRCSELRDQVSWLREQNKNLADRLLAVSNPNALAAFRPDYIRNEYYGSSEDDQVTGFDEFGQQVAIDKDKLE